MKHVIRLTEQELLVLRGVLAEALDSLATISAGCVKAGKGRGIATTSLAASAMRKVNLILALRTVIDREIAIRAVAVPIEQRVKFWWARWKLNRALGVRK